MIPEEPEFDDLCAELLDGQLDAAGSARLAELVAANPGLRQRLESHLLVSGALARENPLYQDERFAESMASQLRSVGDEEADHFPSRIRSRILRKRRQRQLTFALAACLALSAIPFFLGPKDTGIAPPAPAVARATYLPQTKEAAIRQEDLSVGRQIELSKGMMRLEFANGAIVAIESPARFTIRSPEQIDLESGNLNAWCPDSAHGFQVNTHSATLTDLGTSFGVSAGTDGSADFLVLEGEVEVSVDGEQRKLLSGDALRATRGTGLEEVAFEPSAFARTWPVASGIQSTTGEVIPAPPNTPEVVAAHEDDNHIIVIPERRSFLLPPRLPADIRTPGDYGRDTGHPLSSANPVLSNEKTRARSFLLRYNPVGILEFGVFKRFEGSVTFDRPVLAIITDSGKLTESDPIASAAPLPKTAEPAHMRGVEDGPRTEPDRVSLSPDRRTVSVVFYAGESIDEIRVITAKD